MLDGFRPRRRRSIYRRWPYDLQLSLYAAEESYGFGENVLNVCVVISGIELSNLGFVTILPEGVTLLARFLESHSAFRYRIACVLVVSDSFEKRKPAQPR